MLKIVCQRCLHGLVFLEDILSVHSHTIPCTTEHEEFVMMNQITHTCKNNFIMCLNIVILLIILQKSMGLFLQFIVHQVNISITYKSNSEVLFRNKERYNKVSDGLHLLGPVYTVVLRCVLFNHITSRQGRRVVVYTWCLCPDFFEGRVYGRVLLLLSEHQQEG